MVKEESENLTETDVVRQEVGDTSENLKNTNDEEKNPVCVLNEILPNLKYDVEHSGPHHNPLFKVSVNIDGKIYFGTGFSKKSAKCTAASEALKDNIVKKNSKDVKFETYNEKNATVILNEFFPDLKYDVIEHTGPVHNPTYKISVEVDGKVYFGTGSSKKAAKHDAASQVLKENSQLVNQSISKKKKGLKTINIEEKNPVLVLNELNPDLKYDLVEHSGPTHKPTFKVSVELNGKVYLGNGKTKKAAKKAAATDALKSFTSNNGTIISVHKDAKNGNTLDKLRPLMLLNKLYRNANFTCVSDSNSY